MNINDIFTLQEYDEAYNFVKSHEYTSIEDIGNGYYKIVQLHVPTPEEEAQAEKERIAKLHLTKREVLLALYDDKNITPEQIRAKMSDERAKIEFDYATEYYRFNPLIDQIGIVLGYTKEDLDYLFEFKEFKKEESNN